MKTKKLFSAEFRSSDPNVQKPFETPEGNYLRV